MNQEKDSLFAIRLNHQDRAALKAYARKHNIPASEVIRRGIKNIIEPSRDDHISKSALLNWLDMQPGA